MNCVLGHEASETHTHTCHKNGRRGCRFDSLTLKPILKKCMNKARFYVIKRKPGAEMVNPYNEHLLHA